MVLLPEFQPQNPAINGYKYGWASCTAYSGAMAASYHAQVRKLMTGAALRNRTGDFDGGLTLAQIDTALNRYWDVDLVTLYRLPWSTFAHMIDRGQGAVLQGLYAPIADTRFDAGNGFRGNHAVFVPPNWGVMDPLADGRYSGVYKYRGEAYPQSLLRDFAGALDLDPRSSEYKPLGRGYVYAAMTADRVATYKLNFSPGHFWVYTIGHDGYINGRVAKGFSTALTLACTLPKSYTWPGHSSRTLCRVTSVRSGLYGQYVGVPQSNVELETIP
jgi:hypothetical protein